MRLLGLTLAALAGLIVGVLVPPKTFAGEPARLLATFLGIVAASILPTITLLVNSMDPKGRSILRIRELRDQIHAAMHELFVLFTLTSASLAVLIGLTWVPAIMVAWSLPQDDLARRVLLGLLAGSLVLLVQHATRVPTLLVRCLDLRAETAKREGTKQAGQAAKLPADFFASPEGFGESVDRSNVARPSEERR